MIPAWLSELWEGQGSPGQIWRSAFARKLPTLAHSHTAGQSAPSYIAESVIRPYWGRYVLLAAYNATGDAEITVLGGHHATMTAGVGLVISQAQGVQDFYIQPGLQAISVYDGTGDALVILDDGEA